MNVVETDRLRLRWFVASDAPFVFRLLNEPDWIRFIGDKHVSTLDDASRYIENDPVAMYGREGFGLYAVESKETGAPIGMCGLIKRQTLDEVDVGFAFLSEFRSQGFAFEAATAVLAFAHDVLSLRRLVAIVSPDNAKSISLLEKLGFRFEKMLRMQGNDEEVAFYASERR
ncbi:MAG TPA: GNAT family N-acetyltransferase [Casimicrobiaceae bacterium]|nr:GNAT family N-acetyltransferase [Casimicrobiaceae bacterium]